MKNSIYQSYIIKNIIVPLLYCLVILTGMVWLSQILRLIFLFEKQINLLQFIKVIALLIPSLIHIILPFATLYSTLYVFNSLKINKELIVLENAGFTPRLLMAPLLKISMVISIIGIINSSYISPKSYGELKSKLSYYRSNFVNLVIEEGKFNNISRNVVLYLDKKSNNNIFEGIILFDNRDPNSNAILFANKGEIKFNKDVISFDLKNGHRQSFNKAGIFEIMNFDHSTIIINSSKSSYRNNEYKDIQEHYVWELLLPNADSKKLMIKFIAEGHNRLIWPMFNMVLPLVAISIFLKANFNRRDYNKHLFKSFAIAMCFVGMHFLILNYSSRITYLNILLYLNLIIAIALYYFNTGIFFKRS